MLKRKVFLFLVIIIAASIIFHLPTKAVYKLLPLFLQHKYKVSAEVGEIKGGFRDGIVLNNIRLSRGATNIGCEQVVTDIKFLDFIFPDKKHRYSISINSPRIDVRSGLNGNGFIGIPFYLNTHIFMSDAELLIADLGLNSPLKFNGRVSVDDNSIEIDNMRVLLGEFEMEMEGGIDSNKQLNLSSHFINSENRFLIKGTLNKPQIYTRWGDLETSFQIDDIQYDNGQLVFPRISGNIYLGGFPPIDLDGGLCIAKDFVRFNNMTLLEVARINGVVNKDRSSRIRLYMNNIEGAKLIEDVPEILRFLILSHRINADINIYGMMDNLQAGGVLRLLSTPIEILCRYRNNKFSFRSIGEAVFNISGSVNWKKVPTINIRGVFNQIDIKEFMALLGKTVDSHWKGILDGEFKITGELESPLIEAKLEIEDAEFGDMKFDTAYLNLSCTGSGPLNLAHSMVYYKEIPAELTGYIDPKGEDIFKNIEIRPTGDGFIWEGVNIIKDDKGNVVIFGKDVNENISVRFKSALTSDSKESEEEKPEVELEYKLRDDKNLLIKMQEDEGTVGVEHKVKF